MNEEFEAMPFAAAEMESDMAGDMEDMESERGFGRARGTARARPKPRPKTPPQPLARRYGWPRRRPSVFGPYYGGAWPYAVPVAPLYPEPFPYPEPGAEPEPSAEPQAGFDDQAEVPATIAAAVGRLPAAQRPAYQALGAIGNAVNHPAASGPGLYLIEFTSNGQQRAYSGQTNDLRRRLRQHLLCAQMMGLSLAKHQVYVAQLPSLSDTRRRALERRIHADMLARNAGVLTNQRREMEQELLGDEW